MAEREPAEEAREAVLVAPAPGSAPPSPRPRRVPDPRHVPRSYTAIEGRFDDVATAPLWRRVLSMIAITLVAIFIGIAVAAVAAAVIGAIAGLLDAAVG